MLFELIAERYERKSLALTANQPFSGWDQVFPDTAMTLAAVDRLVHHSTIFELNVDSYRRRAAVLGGLSAAKSKAIPTATEPVVPERLEGDGIVLIPEALGGARGEASVERSGTEASPRATATSRTTSRAKTTSKANPRPNSNTAT